MGGLVEDLLELARLDETKPLKLAPVELLPLATDAALDAMASSPTRVVTVLTGDAPPSAAALADTPPETPEPAVPATATSSTARTPRRRRIASDAATSTGRIMFGGIALARLRRRQADQSPEVEVVPLSPSTAENAAPALVMAEENKIRQVLTNLLGNAARFTPPDSPIEIAVLVDRPNDKAILEVIDHGEGIPPQVRDKIFQRFWRADSSRTRDTGGSGLGLAIVSAIVAAHKGTVSVEETPGGGATFRVTLPLLTSAPPREVSTDSDDE
jgi:two-component system OmpR family sensor kinase